jgi:hypothetical protein
VRTIRGARRTLARGRSLRRLRSVALMERHAQSGSERRAAVRRAEGRGASCAHMHIRLDNPATRSRRRVPGTCAVSRLRRSAFQASCRCMVRGKSPSAPCCPATRSGVGRYGGDPFRPHGDFSSPGARRAAFAPPATADDPRDRAWRRTRRSARRFAGHAERAPHRPLRDTDVNRRRGRRRHHLSPPAHGSSAAAGQRGHDDLVGTPGDSGLSQWLHDRRRRRSGRVHGSGRVTRRCARVRRRPSRLVTRLVTRDRLRHADPDHGVTRHSSVNDLLNARSLTRHIGVNDTLNASGATRHIGLDDAFNASSVTRHVRVDDIRSASGVTGHIGFDNILDASGVRRHGGVDAIRHVFGFAWHIAFDHIVRVRIRVPVPIRIWVGIRIRVRVDGFTRADISSFDISSFTVRGAGGCTIASVRIAARRIDRVTLARRGARVDPEFGVGLDDRTELGLRASAAGQRQRREVTRGRG